MKKLIVALSVGALMMGTTAMANENKGAVVITDDGMASCSAQIYVPGYYFPLLLSGDEVHTVINKNMVKTVCKLDIPEWLTELPESAVVVKDFACEMFPDGSGIWFPWWRNGLEATDSQFVWTPSNEATLQCSWKAPKD